MLINNKPDIHQQVICANVFIRKNDKYLVLRRSPLKRYAPNVIHPIGGKVDVGENPYEASLREVKEEAGVEVKNMRLEAVIEELKPHKGEPYNWLIFHFSADYAQGEVTNTEEGELTWMTAEEIKHENLFPSVQLVVDNVFNPAAGTVFATVSYADTGKEHKQLADHSLHYCSL